MPQVEFEVGGYRWVTLAQAARPAVVDLLSRCYAAEPSDEVGLPVLDTLLRAEDAGMTLSFVAVDSERANALVMFERFAGSVLVGMRSTGGHGLVQAAAAIVAGLRDEVDAALVVMCKDPSAPTISSCFEETPLDHLYHVGVGELTRLRMAPGPPVFVLRGPLRVPPLDEPATAALRLCIEKSGFTDA